MTMEISGLEEKRKYEDVFCESQGEQGEMIYLLLISSDEINLSFSQVKPVLLRVWISGIG